jgi:hypothetical protein
VFGRNEPGLQHRHIAWAAAIEEEPAGYVGNGSEYGGQPDDANSQPQHL